jgi:glyoxylase-like metal-dependent hydrolase (beta-lactamase superfamily II)
MARTFTVGDLDVLVLSDGVIRVPATLYFRGTTERDWQPHRRWLDHEGNLEFPMACFLVRSRGKTVLIDTGLGPLTIFQFSGGALLGELAAAGVAPEEIGTVFATHLHVDHCGTCVVERPDGLQPVFPNATYRWSEAEVAYWREHPVAPGTSFSIASLLDAVAGRFEAADDGVALADGVSVIATPGHTPGHAGVVLASGGERAFILGDAISCPAQLEEAEWSGMGDIDPKLARRSQEAVAREIEDGGGLLAAAHFPGLDFGRVLRGEGKRYWEPLAG